MKEEKGSEVKVKEVKIKEDKPKEEKVDKKVFGNGFEIHSIKSGPATGKQAKAGKRVTVKYVGSLQSNGKVFDQTQGNKTFSFRLGTFL